MGKQANKVGKYRAPKADVKVTDKQEVKRLQAYLSEAGLAPYGFTVARFKAAHGQGDVSEYWPEI